METEFPQVDDFKPFLSKSGHFALETLHSIPLHFAAYRSDPRTILLRLVHPVPFPKICFVKLNFSQAANLI